MVSKTGSQKCQTLTLCSPGTLPGKHSDSSETSTLWENESEATQLCPTLCDPMDYSPSGSWSTGLGCHFLLQGIFLTQGSNLGLLHCRQTLYPLSHQGSPPHCEGSPNWPSWRDHTGKLQDSRRRASSQDQLPLSHLSISQPGLTVDVWETLSQSLSRWAYSNS